MSDMTNREAAEAAIAGIRKKAAIQKPKDERERAGRAMCIDLNCVVLAGMGDLLDHGGSHAETGTWLAIGLADAILTYAMTAAGGDAEMAAALVEDLANKARIGAKNRTKEVASSSPRHYGRRLGNA